jgi:phosphatidylserine/phosphatidylglycerophosphate/cardiolipin synthase-like enzyme
LSSQLFDNETFYDAFVSDLARAKHTVIIESPFITSRRMNELFPMLRKLRRKSIRVIVYTRDPDEHDSEYASQAIHVIALMQDIGIMVLYTFKHHRKLAIINNETLWEGNLNILSRNDSCEIMHRIESKELARQMTDFVGLGEFLV